MMVKEYLIHCRVSHCGPWHRGMAGFKQASNHFLLLSQVRTERLRSLRLSCSSVWTWVFVASQKGCFIHAVCSTGLSQAPALVLLVSQRTKEMPAWSLYSPGGSRQYYTQTTYNLISKWWSLVQSLSRVQLFAAPWTTGHEASLSIANSWSLLKLMSIESVKPSSHLILCRPLLLPPSIFPSIRVFSDESILCIRWPKYWSFSFSISPSSEYSGLISFTMDWLDVLAVQGTLKSLLQHHNSKASILQHSVFFIVQLSHPYTTTGKTIALTQQTFVGRVMSLLLNMLSRLVITLLPRSKRLLISWLQSPSAVILEPPKIKFVATEWSQQKKESAAAQQRMPEGRSLWSGDSWALTWQQWGGRSIPGRAGSKCQSPGVGTVR